MSTPDLFNQPPPRRNRHMMKAVATRNAAYAEHRIREGAEGPALPDSQQRVYDLLLAHPKGLSNAEIARKLGWTINRVTPRCYELRQKGRVIEAEKRACTVSGKCVSTWKTV